MTLERAYRRLLACYPVEHRRQYEEEMLGVLLDDADPHQRRPRVKDVRDLLLGAVRTRARCAADNLTAQPWRDAAAVLGLLAPLALFAYAGRLPLLNLTESALWGVPAFTPYSWQLWVPALLWLVVAALVATGWRRTAAVLAAGATVLEVMRAVGEYNDYVSVVNLWPVLLAVLGSAALAVPAPRSAAALLGRWRIALLAGAVLLAGTSLPSVLTGVFPSMQGGQVRTPLVFTNSVTALEAVLVSAGYLLGALTVLSTPAPLRRRLLALLAPVAAIFLTSRTGYYHWSFLDRPLHPGTPIGLNPGQWSVLALTPVLAFAVAVAVVHRRERSSRLTGPAAER